MKRNMMRKNLTQSILRSLGRYIAIAAIIALGCVLFVGLRITKTDMIATGQKYTDDQNMFDLQLLNTYGWSEENLKSIASIDGVVDAQGSVYLDALVYFDCKEAEGVYRLYSIPDTVNRVYLLGGRMPASPDECLIDGDGVTDDVLGSQITVTQGNDEDTLDSLHYQTYTVVGYVSTPLYMDMTRGSTSLGNGSLTSYVYIPHDAFNVDYYTEIFVTIPGAWTVYSDEYNDAMDAFADKLEAALGPIADLRYQTIRQDAEKAYADGMKEYEDGLKEYEEGKLEAEQSLADALKELEDAQVQIDEGWQEIADGEIQLEEAQQQINDGRKELEASAIELENTKAQTYLQIAQSNQELVDNYKTVSESLKQVQDGLAQINDGIAQIDEGLSQIETSLPLLELMVSLLQNQISTTGTALDAAYSSGNEDMVVSLEEALAEQTAQLEEYQSQLETAKQTQAELESTREELAAQREELIATENTLTDAMNAIDMGFMELEAGKEVADAQFVAAQAQIDAGYLELEAGQAELDANKTALEEAKQQLLDSRQQLEEGWAEYEDGKAKAQTELADAEAKLADAAAELKDARQTIDNMGEPSVYALTRNTNAGYLALNSNSDIVEGISRVLPVFFLLIAALVCITTMTRMVEEERTQIGTLKALGYSNLSIMSKYLLYSASAAVIGCTLGCLAGSYLLPGILWEAYALLFNIVPNMLLNFDWLLSLGITIAYTVVSTVVTWYCCHRTLREVPAELIRPKAPKVGKKIFLEYLPFWEKLSFLNKVMLRNVFRYGQRMAMMLIGIGGCTALLLTGFGLRDTICDLANIQFEEVSVYDIQVHFSDGLTQEDQESFRQTVKSSADSVGFFYQTSVELEFDNQARDVNLIGCDDSVTNFINFHHDGQELTMPGAGEAYLTVGVAELLGIEVGDTVRVRNSDLQSMTVEITGIYDNHVYNYIVVTPETVEAQWGEMPAYQMGYVTVRDNVDVHTVSSVISEMDNVMNVSVCEDTAGMVNKMMNALDLVVVVIVFCAGLLAAIVLYNLTNINVNERIREIATIKVLGFNAGETSSYVFKENVLLTVMGAAFGLLLGRWFLDFVMMNIRIDMVWFSTRLNWPSYIYAVGLTLLCAAVVDFVFHFLLDKINMAEALKSVE